MKEQALLKKVMQNIDKEIKRLQKLRSEEDKYEAKVRIIARSCLIVASSDGYVNLAEFDKIFDEIFKRYFIPTEMAGSYIMPTVSNVMVTNLKKDIEQYKIDKEFLNDLYNELQLLGSADKSNLKVEKEALSSLVKTFRLDKL